MGGCGNLGGVTDGKLFAGREFASLDAMMEACAAEAVRLAREDHGMTLDFSAESVGRLETILAARSPVEQERLEDAARIWGGYFGEVFRRRWAAEWVMAVYPGQNAAGTSGGEFAMPALDIGGSQVYPLLKVFRRMTLGIGEDLGAFYAKVAGALEARGKH